MKIRIEIVEDNGLRSTYEIEGQGLDKSFLREKIMEYLSTFNGIMEREVTEPLNQRFSGGTLMERLQGFIKFEFPDNWFTSQELRERYETVIDDIKLSTVSTYLSRMNREGLLDIRGNRNKRQYRLASPNVVIPQINARERRDVTVDRLR